MARYVRIAAIMSFVMWANKERITTIGTCVLCKRMDKITEFTDRIKIEFYQFCNSVDRNNLQIEIRIWNLTMEVS